MSYKAIAIITARGGSKRIPRKNIKDFCGKPIIQYSIEAAISSQMFDEVMVSTDDQEIRDIALNIGASVPFMRSTATSNDMAMTHEVLLEVLVEYKKLGKEFDYVCCIYPTAPFVTVQKLKAGMELLINKNAETVLPIIPFSFPPQRGFIMEGENVKFIYPENMFVRSQDLQPIYHDCGQFYFLNVNKFIQQKKLILDNTIPMIVSELEAQDIDNEEDWVIAEIKFLKMLNRNNK